MKNKEKLLAIIKQNTYLLEHDPVFKLRFSISYLERLASNLTRETELAKQRAAENAKRHRDDREYGICDSFAHLDAVQRDLNEYRAKMTTLVSTCTQLFVKATQSDHLMNHELGPILLQTHPELVPGMWLTRVETGWQIDGHDTTIPVDVIQNYLLFTPIRSVHYEVQNDKFD